MRISLHILWIFLMIGLMMSVLAEAIMPQINQSSTCPDRCGNIDVPYPFGIGENCSLPLDSSGDNFWSRNFKLECNNSAFDPPRLFADEQEIINITLNPPKLHLKTGVAYICDDGSEGDDTGIGFLSRPFYVSSEENVHRAFGCNTNSTIESSRFRGYSFETCISTTCSNDMELADISSCNGTGCCVTKMPPFAFMYDIKLAKLSNTSDNHFSNRCIYSFVMKNSTDDFDKPSDLGKMNKTMKVSVVAEWYVGDLCCEEAQKNKTTYACVKNNHTQCQNSPRSMGYFCKCAKGYEGNPYLNGCQGLYIISSDINECLEEGKCLNGSICINTDGGYHCECPSGTKGDPVKNIPCVKESRQSLAIFILLGIGLLLLFALGLFISWSFHKRKFLKLRKQFFRGNGGLFLQDQIAANPNLSFKIFPIKEIEDATKKFDKEMVLGKGGQGTVYKGNLGEGRMVAIKRSMMAEERNTKEFANEMLILSQINHVNIVKLLGCCLESEVPMLVYEFVPNKTLFHFIQIQSHTIPIPWSSRLNIGVDTAKGLPTFIRKLLHPFFMEI
ncbi:hypothetical protein ZOSMA_13G00020 [Zostera marina]|uniref:Protein kinase domain-containing protein n=1 Tax=Zostera marina TaxID=29655 RepID=A0A0K9PXR2_ZOSMR|nr:hypothetical protein ZOSMA_13G00020 [Zostera marina]